MELSHAPDFSLEISQKVVADEIDLLPTSAELWNQRHFPLGPEEVLFRQCKLGDLCWPAAVSRPDIRIRAAVLAANVSSLHGYDVYWINDLIRSVKRRQAEVILENSSKLEVNHMRTVGWSDAAFGDPSENGKCRLGFMLRLLPLSLEGPCRLIHCPSRFARRTAKSSLARW